MSDYIDKVFDDFGSLASCVPNYARREGQVQLARAVDDVIRRGGILLGEGPCGCGKSFAYAVPAISDALHNSRRALIVTANKAMQEQLHDKDLPTLVRALDGVVGPFSFKLVKGWSNYLCLRDYRLHEDGAIGWPSGIDEDEIDALCAWAMATSTGDQTDAPLGTSDKLWRAVSVSPDQCDHFHCHHFKDCFAERAVREADDATVVVANYDLFFYKLKSLNGSWLNFGTVILDEAHEAPEIARRCFGYEIDEWDVRELARAFVDRLGERGVARELTKTAGPFFDKVARYVATAPGGRLKMPDFVDPTELVSALGEAAVIASTPCAACGDEMRRGCGDCMQRDNLRERAVTLQTHILEFVGQSGGDTAYWIEKPRDDDRLAGGTVKLRAAPYQVGEILAKQVFDKFHAVIAVSATLTSGGAFDYIKTELGAPRAQTIRVGSPFDFKRQARLVIPYGIPFPLRENEAAFDEAAASAVLQLVQDCHGRLLGLFTSWHRLRYVRDKLKGNVDYPLLCQGDAPNKMLAKMFRETTDSVLLATRSFWMGLDVPGESLSCLVIDKLPFESFDDPIVDMMKSRHPDTFFEEFYVPRAAIALAQGAGRLIRTLDDHGVLVLLDQRVKVAKYGRAFLNSLPFVGYEQDLGAAGRFLDAVSKAA
jgi:ATP-dependent DNA helicase DinG